jgi:hypothetical protein
MTRLNQRGSSFIRNEECKSSTRTLTENHYCQSRKCSKTGTNISEGVLSLVLCSYIYYQHSSINLRDRGVLQSMAANVPTLLQVEKILGRYSIASIRTWLKSQKLTSTASSRIDIAKRVHGLLENGKVDLETVIDGLIGIEESASKLVYVYQIDPTKANLERIDQQLLAIRTLLSPERSPASEVKTTPRLVYAINDAAGFRAKWAEKQARLVANHTTRTFNETPVTRVVVLALDKKTGVVQLRYDKPLDVHTHKIDGHIRDQAYFSYYKEQAENMIGLPLEPRELRPGLQKVLLSEPPIVIPVVVEHLAEDGGTNKSGHRKKGGDPRKTKDWIEMHKPGAQPRTYESSPMRWIPEMSDDNLIRPVLCTVDGRTSTVRFDADCHEAEVNYVLAKLL